MSQSFLILHGIGNHRPPQHWQFLLAAALVERGYEVRYPGLPSPDAPVLDEWMRALERELGAMSGARTVVAHSLGCMLWFTAAAAGLAEPVDRVLLVAPPASAQVPEAGAAFRLDTKGLDVDAIRASVTSELALACSDSDPYNPIGAQSLYGDPLGLTATIIPGAAHITPDDGYGAWPWVLGWCLRRPAVG